MKIFGYDITNASKKMPQKARITKGIIEQQLHRIRQDINKWRSAVVQAESKMFPNRRLLYQTYQDIVLDGHLSGLIELRKSNITGKVFKIVDQKGEEVEDKTKILDAMWFYDFLNLALDSRYFGFSLIQFDTLINDKFSSIELIPREYVSPEKEEVSDLPGVMQGISYLDRPYADWLIPVGNKKDLGLLMKLAPYVIWKKGAVGAWSEASEMFGMPIRIGRTNIQDPEMKKNMEDMLTNMGSAAWGVFDTSDILELLQTTKTDVYAIYDKLIERCNSEMSKIVLGHSAVIDATSGKLGSEDNALGSIASYIESDCRFIRFVINDQLIPFMNNKGMGFDNLSCVFDDSEELSLLDQFTIDGKLLEFYDIPEDYIEKTYGTTVIKKKEPAGGMGMGKPQPIIRKIKDLYSNVHLHLDNKKDKERDKLRLYTPQEEEGFLSSIYNGFTHTRNLDVNMFRKLAEKLTEGIYKGFGKTIIETEFGTPDRIMLEALKENAFIFSGAKTYQQVKEINSMIVSETGELRSFAEFKKIVKPIFEDYNVNYLRTEYDLAVGNSQMASKWLDIERDKDILPYLKYETIGDSRVRPTHASLDNIIKKVDDPFWDSYLPKNGWNCRCSVTQLHEGVETDTKSFVKPDDVPDMFMFNPGKKKIIFPKEHPYFDVVDRDKALASNNFNLPFE